MITIPHPRAIVLTTLLLTTGGVALVDAQNNYPADRTPAAAMKEAENPDSNLIGAIMRADRAEVAYSRAALPYLKDAEVRALAQKMIDGHTAHQANATSIAARLHVPPPTEVAMGAEGTAMNDKDYIAGVVTRHQQLLAQLPADGARVHDAGLKSHVAETRRAVQMHLDAAMKIQARLAGTAP